MTDQEAREPDSAVRLFRYNCAYETLLRSTSASALSVLGCSMVIPQLYIGHEMLFYAVKVPKMQAFAALTFAQFIIKEYYDGLERGRMAFHSLNYRMRDLKNGANGVTKKSMRGMKEQFQWLEKIHPISPFNPVVFLVYRADV